MSKQSRTQRSSRSLLGTLLAAIVLIVAVIVSFFGNGLQDVTPTLTPTVGSGTQVAVVSDAAAIAVPQGFGAQYNFWQVYFTAPTGSSDRTKYVGGIDNPLAQVIDGARGTLDIAAFEFNDALITQAVLNAKNRGVTVRVVTDDVNGLEADDTTLNQLTAVGIPVVDDGRSALMHNKFMIMDSTTVWTGSWNYTVNGTYRNNNNAVVLRSRRAVESYQAEFNEMFEQRAFGPRSPTGNAANFNQDGTPIRILFAPEDDVVGAILDQLNQADSSVRFMAFSFTVDDIGNMLKQKAAAGVSVQGIFETVGSETAFSELTPLFCAGLPVRQDGNPYILHHKVFIVDNDTVLTGSFNFSDSAMRSNDENMLIIHDPVLAGQYIAEFERRWAEAVPPDGLTCS
ncbi:MAG: FAM83 family protein [Anaerolineae bacterium]|nr:FAM83 family protein [Anaerolineae bacterium]